MILANLRASAWKYGAIAATVLAVAALVAAVIFRGSAIGSAARAEAAEVRTQELAGQLEAAKQAAARDDLSTVATTTARTAANDRLTQHNDRAARVAEIANAPREPVPAVCPGPDADLLRELAEGSARVSAASDRLRSLGGPASGKAK